LEIKGIEKALGKKTPEDYLKFVKEYGGAFVGGLVDGYADLPILAFFCPDDDTGILYNLNAYRDLRGDGILPIADCELGDIYALDRENAVHYINFYGGETTSQKIADRFQDFVDRIVATEE